VIKPDEYDVSDRYEPLAICDADDINNVFYNSSIDIKELDRAIKKLEPEWMREYRANRKEVNMNETEKAQLEMKQEVREIVQSNDFKVIGLSTYGKSKTYTIVTNEED